MGLEYAPQLQPNLTADQEKCGLLASTFQSTNRKDALLCSRLHDNIHIAVTSAATVYQHEVLTLSYKLGL